LVIFYASQPLILSISCVELFVIFINFLILRAIIWNPKESYILAAIIVSVILVTFVFSGTIYGLVIGSFVPVAMVCLPVDWILMQGSSIYILWCFLSKVRAKVSETEVSNMRAKMLDNDILYANT